MASAKPSETELFDWLKTVMDPELGLPLVDLGLIYTAKMNDQGKVRVQMTLTSPACPAADGMIADIKSRLAEHSSVQDIEVEIVWEPKWDPSTMASEEVKEELGIW